METPVNTATWDRKDAYELFKTFEDPFFGVQINLDITALWARAKAGGHSIHHALLYATTKVANDYAPMRYRRRGAGVVELDCIHMGCSVLVEGTEAMTFAYYPWEKGIAYAAFEPKAKEITQNAASGIPLDPMHHMDNLIYGTTLPWISFSGFKHAKKAGTHSIPRTVFGKAFDQEGKKLLPFNIEVDHALMDGIHVARYLELLQNELDHLLA